jgi:hypothetical protein
MIAQSLVSHERLLPCAILNDLCQTTVAGFHAERNQSERSLGSDLTVAAIITRTPLANCSYASGGGISTTVSAKPSEGSKYASALRDGTREIAPKLASLLPAAISSLSIVEI